MKPTTCWGALALMLTPFGAWALGLGDIALSSALNQPLDAEIELVSATEDELATLNIGLASLETFERYGLDRPAFLNGIEFQLNVDNFGSAVVSVSSQDAIAEPFVTILVEVTWARGRLLREYTVLLDPPVLLPVPEVTQAVQPAQTGASATAEPAAAINRPAAAALPPAATPVLETLDPVQAAPTAAVTGSYGPVQSAETLWSVAEQSRPAGVTMNQMMVAIYEANPQSFGGNMNTLHQGVTLRIPQAAELAAISAAAATQEAIRQAALWQGGDDSARLRLVTPESTADVAAAGGGNAAAATAAEAAAAAAVADLEGELDSVRGELENSQRLLEIRDQQLQDLQAQLTAAEALEQSAAADNIGAEPGVDLESEPLFADEAEQPVAPAPAVAPPAASIGVVSAPPEPSLISRILGWLLSPILLIGLGLIALTGTAVWYLRYRQQDADDVTGRWEALEADLGEDDDAGSIVVESAELDEVDDDIVVDESPDIDFSADSESDPFDMSALTAESDLEADVEQEAENDAVAEASQSAPTMTIGVPASEPRLEDTISSQTVINLEQADPVAEADFHMAYGLYDQAAELVEKALEAEPGRRDLTLKLLEVFFVWGNKDSFLQTAQALHSEIGSGPDSDWDKVVIMGKQICPDDGLFSAVSASAGSVDVDLEAGESPALDLAFDADDGAGVDLDLGDLGLPEVDLELEASGAQPVAGEELDLGDQTAAGLEAALFEQVAGDDNVETITDGDADADVDVKSALDNELDLDDELDLDIEFGADAESLAATQESPTIETPVSPTEDEAGEDADADSLAATQESPTVETPVSASEEEAGFDPGITDTSDADILDSPTLEAPLETSLETSLDGTGELPTVEQPGVLEQSRDQAERTAEIDLDDLGLDVDDLSDLTGDLSALAGLDDSPSEIEHDVLSSADVSDVLDVEADGEAVADDDETLLAASNDDETLLAATIQVPGAGESSDSSIGDQDATLLAPGYGEELATSTQRLSDSSAENLEPDDSIAQALDDLPEDVAASEVDDTLAEVLEKEAGLDVDDSLAGVLDDLEEVAVAAEFNTELEDALAATAQDQDPAEDVPADAVASASLDLDLDEFASALEGSDTVEQPIAQSVGSDIFPDSGENTHLDIGSQTSLGDETISGRSSLLDPHTMTMTEVGTKLDLARAYVDMGDPDGARSILEEVLEEGDEDQQTEANKIINEL